MELSQDVVALVSGGASGLGRATVEELSEAGARVVIADLASSEGAAVADALGDGVRFCACDVTSSDDVAAAVAAAGELGTLRVAVSCAGIGTPGRVLGRNGPLALEQFQQVVEINLVGTFNLLRLAAESMAGAEPVGEERGVIVNTASAAAFEGQIGQAAYSASKGGVVGMTLSVARDLAGRQVRNVTIAPGLFETPMLAGLSQEIRESLGEQVPHPRRLGKPAEYAKLARHIVENPMINGETMRLDGALRMAAR
ncbi:MAG: 3-hydroxyacyl-CoA dehydrogenase [Actinobacteria bacterium QS_8_72_14]|nr:MAG: 3-hydroxyacyl-CoA dehydrogenase [Actinobacteria bacterium QS_8_72_14]